jgi:hypothetical protein
MPEHTERPDYGTLSYAPSRKSGMRRILLRFWRFEYVLGGIIGIVLIALVAWSASGKTGSRDPQRGRTVINMGVIETIVTLSGLQGESSAPRTIEDVRALLHPSQAWYLRDGWDRPLEFFSKLDDKSGETTFVIRSAGPDGQLETADDVAESFSVRWAESQPTTTRVTGAELE